MAPGMRFFDYDRLGYIPHDCWEECELEPVDKESLSGKSRKRRRLPTGYLTERRPFTPEEVLINREAREFDPERVEIGGLKFSLRAAARLAQFLAYEKVTDEVGLIIGHYLSENTIGQVKGMDGVIKLLTKFNQPSSLWDAAIDFAVRMIPHCPEISQNSRAALIKEARRNKKARELGVILFGRVFARWVNR